MTGTPIGYIGMSVTSLISHALVKCFVTAVAWGGENKVEGISDFMDDILRNPSEITDQRTNVKMPKGTGYRGFLWTSSSPQSARPVFPYACVGV